MADKHMTRLDLIQLVGEVVTAIDVLRSQFDRKTKRRTALDNYRDALDTAQRKFVREMFQTNTKAFVDLTKELKALNKDLKETIESVEKVAESLELLVKFVGVVQKIAGLIL